jgi:hypothetical protein
VHVRLRSENVRRFRQRREIDGVRVRVLGLRGLLLTKEGLREKDRADRVALQSAVDALDARS